MGVGIAAIEQQGNEVLARTSDGEARRYDLVVGADGIHSTVRRLVFGESPTFDTGWGGWVWWADHGLVPHDTVTEYWGAGRFLGVYPTKHRIGIVACGPVKNMDPDDRAGRRETFQRMGALGLARQKVADCRRIDLGVFFVRGRQCPGFAGAPDQHGVTDLDARSAVDGGVDRDVEDV